MPMKALAGTADMREILALAMLAALAVILYAVAAASVYGESKYGLPPLFAGLLGAFAAFAGYAASAAIDRLE